VRNRMSLAVSAPDANTAVRPAEAMAA